MVKRQYEDFKTERIDGAKVTIISTEWHKEHIQKMVQASNDILKKAGAELDFFEVPGSLRNFFNR